MGNLNLRAAKRDKNDEFYTQLSDIQLELNFYIDKFKDKVVFCNCDDPFESNFVKYFLMNFNRLGLKELIATGYKTSPIVGSEIGEKNIPYSLKVKSTAKYLIGTQKDLDISGAKYFLEVEGNNIMTPLIGNLAKDGLGNQIFVEVKEKYMNSNGEEKTRKVKKELYYNAGDFRSDESIALLKEADIVVTNPPFSLFREYLSVLVDSNKEFLIIGNKNAITYREIFNLIKENKMWLGCSVPNLFMDSTGKITKKVQGLTRWFTNIDHIKRHTILPLDLGYTYIENEEMYPKYDNYNAINIDKVHEIPCDYIEINDMDKKCNGVMGVPITFLDKYCPEQFELLGIMNTGEENPGIRYPNTEHGRPLVKGVEKYLRILIKRK